MNGTSDEPPQDDGVPKSMEREGIVSFVPALAWIRDYSAVSARGDLIAGVLLAALLVPQAVAYAQLAGLAPKSGLIAALAPPLLYALFGTSRYLSIGPVAILSLLSASAVGGLASAGASPLVLAGALGVVVGIIQLIIGFARLGFIINFISEPALSGFINGAAILILFTQLPTLLGLDIDARGVVETVRAMVSSFDAIKLPDLAFGLAALAAFLTLPPIFERAASRTGLSSAHSGIVRQFAPLVVVSVSLVVTWAMSREGVLDVTTTGAVSAAFEGLTLPPMDVGLWRQLVADAFAIAMLGYVIALGAATSLAGTNRQKIDPDNEATALGFCNIGAGLTGGYAVGASLSRSAVVAEAGAKTPLASVFGAAIVLAAMLGAGAIFEFLPTSVLAALIVSAVVGMLKPAEVWRFVRFGWSEAAAVLTALLGTIVFGASWGISLGAAVSLLHYLYQTSKPRIVVEGFEKTTGRMKDIDGDDVAETDDSVLVLRVDENLYFGNARFCEQTIMHAVADRDRQVDVVIDLNAVGMIDATGLDMLKRIRGSLDRRGVSLSLANARKPVVARLEEEGFMDEISDYFGTAEDAAEGVAR